MNMNFIVYSRDNCPFCDRIKKVLDLCLEQYPESEIQVLTLEEDFSRQDFMGKFGKHSTFPQVIMNGLHLGGCKDTVQYLTENNLLNLHK